MIDRACHCPRDQRPDPQCPGDAVGGCRTVPIGPDAVGADHAQRLDLDQLIDQVFGEPVGDGLDRAVTALRVEVEHRDVRGIPRGHGSGRLWSGGRHPVGRLARDHDRPERRGARESQSSTREEAAVPPGTRDIRVRQRPRELLHALEPVGGNLLEGPLERGLHRGRNMRPHVAYRGRGLLAMLRHDRLRRGTGEGRLAGQHFVDHARQAVQVASPIDLVTAIRLFGAHVGRRPQGQPRGGQIVHCCDPDRPREAEVRDHGVGGLQQDVRRLDVAMHHVLGVGIGEPFRHFAGDANGVRERQLTLAANVVAETFAGDVGHDVEEEPIRLSRVVDREDMGMGQP